MGTRPTSTPGPKRDQLVPILLWQCRHEPSCPYPALLGLHKHWGQCWKWLHTFWQKRLHCFLTKTMLVTNRNHCHQGDNISSWQFLKHLVCMFNTSTPWVHAHKGMSKRKCLIQIQLWQHGSSSPLSELLMGSHKHWGSSRTWPCMALNLLLAFAARAQEPASTLLLRISSYDGCPWEYISFR